MNKEQHKRRYRSQLSRQLLMQYLLALVGLVIGYAALVMVGWSFLAQFTWYGDELIYQMLEPFRENLIFWSALILGVGALAVTYYFISKPLRYLDELVDAAGRLARPDDTPIELPASMRNVEDQLNLVRQQALRAAAQAREAEQRKNDLIVYLAHDLKTPLTSVIGYLSLLRDEPQISPELRAKYTGIALDKAERLEDLINEFFDITRFNLSQLTLETCPVDLTRMLEQIASEFEPMFAEKDLRYALDLPDSLPYDCDPDKLARVFDNLLRNACHYSFPGSTIQISAQTAADSIVLRFTNPGKTIPPDKLGRLFEQFFRLDASRGTRTGGAGLGLAIAKEIVELHGGAIRAESRDNTVSFVVTLPTERKS